MSNPSIPLPAGPRPIHQHTIKPTVGGAGTYGSARVIDETQAGAQPAETLRTTIAKEVINALCKGPQQLAHDLYRNQYTPNNPRLRLAVTPQEYTAFEEMYTLLDGKFDGKIGHAHLVIEDTLKIPAPSFEWSTYVGNDDK